MHYTRKGEWVRKTIRGNRRDNTLIEQHLKSKKEKEKKHTCMKMIL